MTDPHLDQQLARGFLPFCCLQGMCKVQGRRANLWYAMAKALGFEVKIIRCQDSVFVGQVSGFCPGLRSLTPYPGRLRRPNHLPDIIFLDSGSFLMGPDSTEYWKSWTTPHLFYDLGIDDSVGGSIIGRRGASTPVGHGAAAHSPPTGWTV